MKINRLMAAIGTLLLLMAAVVSSPDARAQAAAQIDPTPTAGLVLQLQPTATPTVTFGIQGQQSTPTPTTGSFQTRPTSTPTPPPTPDVSITLPSPTPTQPPPTLTPTPLPIVVATPTPTATPTATPAPLAVPSPTPTPTVTPTPPPLAVPSLTPTPTVTPTPLSLVVPTPTPTPTAELPLTVPTLTPTPEFDSLLPPGQIGGLDLALRWIEVTQGIQNLDSTMPLAAGRNTWVRLHPWVPEGEPVSFIDGALLLQRAGMPDTILHPVNGDITFSDSLDRTDLNSALNFELDSSWLDDGDLTLTGVVWSGIPSNIEDEPIVSNNTRSLTVNFQELEQPRLLLVPLHDGTGPGPDHTANSMIDAYQVTLNDLYEFHPTTSPEVTIHPIQLGPTSSASQGDVVQSTAWDLTTGIHRTAANVTLKHFEINIGIGENVDGAPEAMGIFHNSLDSGGFSGWANNGVSWSMPTYATPAHEYAHDIGFSHVACIDSDGDGVSNAAGGGGLDDRHPNAFPNCSLAPIDTEGYFGFTTYRDDITIYSNDPTHPNAAFPLMSYAGPKWNDAYHWCRMFPKYGGDCVPVDIGVPGIPVPTGIDLDCSPTEDQCFSVDIPTPPWAEFEPPEDEVVLAVPGDTDEWLVVLAQIDAGDDLASQPIFMTTERRPGDRGEAELADLLEHIAEGEISSEAIVRVRNGAGEIVAAVPAAFRSAGQAGDLPSEFTLSVAAFVPWPADAVTAELVVRGEVFAERSLSAADPVVDDVAVALGATSAEITWAATDGDDDALTYDVRWSHDDGQTWLPVAQGVAGTSLSIAENPLLPGGTIVVEVTAHDGLRSNTATSEAVISAQRPPVTEVLTPATGTAVNQHRIVELTAFAQDPETGIVADDMVSWTSDLDGPLGTGRRLTRSNLSVGEHTITVTATDVAGASSSASIRLLVLPAESLIVDDPSDELLTAFGLAAATDVGDAADADVQPAAAAVPDDDGAPITVATTTGDFPIVPIAVAGAAVVASGAALAFKRRKPTQTF